MSLISVAQFFEMGRQSGVFLVTEPEGRAHSAVLLEGTIVEASSRHLRGREAALALLSLKDGRFAFGNREVHAPGVERLGISPTLMDVVRLEDELERLAASRPDEAMRLVLRNPHEVPTDPLECGADTVMAAIAARPRTTIAKLLELVPLAPIKVRLATAWLSTTGRLRTKTASGAHPAVPAPKGQGDWYGRLLEAYPMGLRVVLAVQSDQGAHSVIGSITDLAKELDSGPAWMSVSPNGSAVARVRPRAGALLSIVCLPMRSEHEESFRRFVGTADVVLLCAHGERGLTDAWRAMTPARIRKLEVGDEPSGSCLAAALRRFAESLDPFAPPVHGGRR